VAALAARLPALIITAVYPKACAVKLPNSMQIFPVFHNSLLRSAGLQLALPGQNLINNAKSRYVKGRIFTKKDEKKRNRQKMGIRLNSKHA
jgi:hypothetical protein